MTTALPQDILKLVVNLCPVSAIAKFSLVSKRWFHDAWECQRSLNLSECRRVVVSRALSRRFNLLHNLEAIFWPDHYENIQLTNANIRRVANLQALLSNASLRKISRLSIIDEIKEPLTKDFSSLKSVHFCCLSSDPPPVVTLISQMAGISTLTEMTLSGWKLAPDESTALWTQLPQLFPHLRRIDVPAVIDLERSESYSLSKLTNLERIVFDLERSALIERRADDFSNSFSKKLQRWLHQMSAILPPSVSCRYAFRVRFAFPTRCFSLLPGPTQWGPPEGYLQVVLQQGFDPNFAIPGLLPPPLALLTAQSNSRGWKAVADELITQGADPTLWFHSYDGVLTSVFNGIFGCHDKASYFLFEVLNKFVREDYRESFLKDSTGMTAADKFQPRSPNDSIVLPVFLKPGGFDSDALSDRVLTNLGLYCDTFSVTQEWRMTLLRSLIIQRRWDKPCRDLFNRQFQTCLSVIDDDSVVAFTSITAALAAKALDGYSSDDSDVITDSTRQLAKAIEWLSSRVSPLKPRASGLLCYALLVHLMFAASEQNTEGLQRLREEIEDFILREGVCSLLFLGHMSSVSKWAPSCLLELIFLHCPDEGLLRIAFSETLNESLTRKLNMALRVCYDAELIHTPYNRPKNVDFLLKMLQNTVWTKLEPDAIRRFVWASASWPRYDSGIEEVKTSSKSRMSECTDVSGYLQPIMTLVPRQLLRVVLRPESASLSIFYKIASAKVPLSLVVSNMLFTLSLDESELESQFRYLDCGGKNVVAALVSAIQTGSGNANTIKSLKQILQLLQSVGVPIYQFKINVLPRWALKRSDDPAKTLQHWIEQSEAVTTAPANVHHTLQVPQVRGPIFTSKPPEEC